MTLSEAKLYLRVEDEVTDDDTRIGDMITSAREYCEGYQNRAYLQQSWEVSFDHWPERIFNIPLPPLQEITAIICTDKDGIEATIDSDSYLVDTKSTPGRVALKSGQKWPSVALAPISGFRVEFTAGYESAETVPKRIKQAMLLLIGHWYLNREPVGQVGPEIEFTVNALLGLDRVWPI
ncbi:MAG: head-tail connector protein [Negativicutes bacterium]|nr:head-tail connector protein [Negativicutes bacterium]